MLSRGVFLQLPIFSQLPRVEIQHFASRPKGAAFWNASARRCSPWRFRTFHSAAMQTRNDAVVVAQSLSNSYCRIGLGWFVARKDLAARATELNEFFISHAPADHGLSKSCRKFFLSV